MEDWLELKQDLELHLELDAGLTLDPTRQDAPAHDPAAPAGPCPAPTPAPNALAAADLAPAQSAALPAPGGEWFDNELLFDREGHLTDDGLRAMQAGRLDELGSLEAAEHLTFCDRCLTRYTALLDAIPLLEPARDRVPQTQRALQMRSFRLFTNRYITVAAAVLLAFTLWNVGVFQTPRRAQAALPGQPTASISRLFSGALDSVQGVIDGALGSMQASLQSGLSQLSAADPGAGPAEGGIPSPFSNLKGE